MSQHIETILEMEVDGFHIRLWIKSASVKDALSTAEGPQLAADVIQIMKTTEEEEGILAIAALPGVTKAQVSYGGKGSKVGVIIYNESVCDKSSYPR